jgi:hypothetical protein
VGHGEIRDSRQGRRWKFRWLSSWTLLFDDLRWTDVALVENTLVLFCGIERCDVVDVGGLLTYANVMMPY